MTGNMSVTANFTLTTPPPQIAGLSPSSGLVSSAATISGSNFGSSGTVAFNGTPAPVISWSPTAVCVTVPNGATSGNVVITVGGQPSNGSAFTVVVAPLGASMSLHVNLSFMPFSLYDYNHPAAQNGFSVTCPAGASVRGCFQTVLRNLASQSVTGLRVVLSFCDGSSLPFSAVNGSGQTIATCQPAAGQGPISFNPLSGPGYTWIQNVTSFFEDVKSANIKNVTITTGSSGAATISAAKSQASSPLGSCGGGFCCSDTPDPVYFNPTEPFGLALNGDPLGFRQQTNSNEGYNCAPINNQNFLGWNNLFSVVNAVLQAANGQVTVSELEFGQQEVNLADFPAYLRYIVDNSSPASGQYVVPYGSYVDVLARLP